MAFFLFVFIVIIIGLASICFTSIRRKNSSFLGSKGNVCPGYSNPFSSFSTSPLGSWEMAEKLKEDHNKYGSIFQGWFGYMKVIFVADPVIVQNLLRSKVDGSSLKRVAFGKDPFAEEMFGESLIRKDSNEWIHQKMILEPAFRYGHLRQIVQIFSRCSQQVVDQWLKQMPKNETEIRIDVNKWMSRLTLDLIGLAGFGFDFEARIETPTMAPYQRAYSRLMEFLLSPLRMFAFFIPGFSGWTFIPQIKEAYENLNQLNSLLIQVIEKRKQKLKTSQEGEKDMLELMIGSSKATTLNEEESEVPMSEDDNLPSSEAEEIAAPLSTKQLKDNLFLLYVAGHETSASALSWCLYELALDQEVQNKARQEVDHIFQQKVDEGLSFSDLSKMDYLQSVLKEILRLRSPATLVLRQVSEDDNNFKIGDYSVPPKTMVFINLYSIHHNEVLWPDPYKFDPERFMTKVVEGGSKTNSVKHPFAWIPFSAGPRSCIGSKFSLLEMKVTLALILKNFEVIPDPSYKLQIAPDLRPKDLKLIFRKRQM